MSFALISLRTDEISLFIMPSMMENMVITSLPLDRTKIPVRKQLLPYRPYPLGCMSAGKRLSDMPSSEPTRTFRQPSRFLDFTPSKQSKRGCPSSVAEISNRFCRCGLSVLPISTHSSPFAGSTPANSEAGTLTFSPLTADTRTQ